MNTQTIPTTSTGTQIRPVDMKLEVVVLPVAVAEWPDWYAAYMVADQTGTELPA